MRAIPHFFKSSTLFCIPTVMIKVLGLLLFFGLTGLILWSFSESLWRVDDEEGSDTHLSESEASQENAEVLGENVETGSTPRTVQ
jgi:hypothetical protein